MELRLDRNDKRLASDRFSIQFLNSDSISCKDELVGSVEVGEFSESFRSSLTYWTREQYVSQWQQALKQITGSSEKEALITSMYDPKVANFINVWALYRDYKKVYFQEHILFLNEVEFNESNPSDSVCSRETIDVDGNQVSEWSTAVATVQEFLNSSF